MSATKGRDCVLGIDFGTDSVRAVVVDAADGWSAGAAVSAYGRWAKGEFCEPRSNQLPAASPGLRGRHGGGRRARPRRGRTRDRGEDTRHRDRHDGLDARASPTRRARPSRSVPSFIGARRDVRPLEGPYGGGRGRAINQLARGWGGEDFTPVRGRHLLLGVVLGEGPAVVENGPKVVAEARTVWSTATGSRPAHRDEGPGEVQARPLRRRAQGHVARHLGRVPRRGLPGQAGPAALAARVLPRHGDLYRGYRIRKLSPEWAEGSAYRRRSSSRSAPSTPISERWAATSAPAHCSRSWARAPAT